MTERSKKLQTLAAGYSRSWRKVEILAISAYVGLELLLAWRLAGHISLKNLPLLVLAGLCGYLGADFVSGFLHWAADTWGTVHWPLIGQSLVRTFREHHLDPRAMTRHDFVETNGDVCLMALPFLTVGACIEIRSPFSFFMVATLALQCFWGTFTNQIHKWSHLGEVPKPVEWLQRSRLILPPRQHALHHAPPYARDYCITSGWLNGPLRWTRFFWILEIAVNRLTGAIPREDDLGLEAALRVAKARGILPESHSSKPGKDLDLSPPI